MPLGQIPVSQMPVGQMIVGQNANRPNASLPNASRSKYRSAKMFRREDVESFCATLKHFISLFKKIKIPQKSF
jgi:hypothetical protein